MTERVRQIEGSQAVAETVALCRPEVICAYPISPQTHIVEGLSGGCGLCAQECPCGAIEMRSETV
jgi:pyruvate ferredoxin oxidoreductase alpha subunit